MGKSRANLRRISGKSWADPGHILGNSRANLWPISGKSWVNHDQISGKSLENLRCISDISQVSFKSKCDFTHLVVPRTCLFKCLLSPAVQVHLFRIYVCPVARSGLSAMTLSDNHLDSLSMFHRKILRGFLHLSNRSPIPALFFLTGELPIVARLHRDVFSLFYNIWINPHTKIFSITKYLLENHKPYLGQAYKISILYVWIRRSSRINSKDTTIQI